MTVGLRAAGAPGPAGVAGSDTAGERPAALPPCAEALGAPLEGACLEAAHRAQLLVARF